MREDRWRRIGEEPKLVSSPVRPPGEHTCPCSTWKGWAVTRVPKQKKGIRPYTKVTKSVQGTWNDVRGEKWNWGHVKYGKNGKKEEREKKKRRRREEREEIWEGGVWVWCMNPWFMEGASVTWLLWGVKWPERHTQTDAPEYYRLIKPRKGRGGEPLSAWVEWCSTFYCLPRLNYVKWQQDKEPAAPPRKGKWHPRGSALWS